MKKQIPIAAAALAVSVLCAGASALTLAREQNAFKYPWESEADSSNNPMSFSDQAIELSYSRAGSGGSTWDVPMESGDKESPSPTYDGAHYRWTQTTSTFSWKIDQDGSYAAVKDVWIRFRAKAWGRDTNARPTLPEGEQGVTVRADLDGECWDIDYLASLSSEPTPWRARSYTINFYQASASFNIAMWTEQAQ